ncbi:MAG: AraC family transcriptional regulator, partial [Hungatella sp.]
QNYQNPDFNMSALAETLGVSGVTLAVEFKSSMGISPSDYLAIIRMERAKVLLKESQLRIKEVSVSVGYEDDHVFMRRFKKYVGKTPGEYRKEEG